MEHLFKEQITAMGRYFGQIVELYAAWAKTKGISYNKLAIIATLFYQPYGTQSQVCADWAIPKQTVSTICKGLEKEGFIHYLHIANDNREKCMALTKEGQVAFRPLMKELRTIETQALTIMGETQIQELLRSMHCFIEAFKAGATQVAAQEGTAQIVEELTLQDTKQIAAQATTQDTEQAAAQAGKTPITKVVSKANV